MFWIKLPGDSPPSFWDVGLSINEASRKVEFIEGLMMLVLFSYLLMTKKHDKYSKRAKIGADIDRLFPNKGLVIERGNFGFTPEELDVAASKGLKINY